MSLSEFLFLFAVAPEPLSATSPLCRASRRFQLLDSWFPDSLAECFDPSDNAAHDAAYHAANRIPAAHP